MSGQKSRDLYKEMQKSLQEDKLYWVRNDAKIRAAVTSKNYEEFRDYVAAAHLNTITKKEMREKKDLNWNKIASNSK